MPMFTETLLADGCVRSKTYTREGSFLGDARASSVRPPTRLSILNASAVC